MVATAAFFFASLVAFASAKSTLVLHEQRDVPEGYTVTGKANPATKLNLRLGLASRDFAGLEKALYDVSTPSSKSYGQHLNRDEVCLFLLKSWFVLT
jgi:tripeptidyl-peptidase-1